MTHRRAVGDFDPKNKDQRLPAERQAVTAFPEVKALLRKPDDEFVVLACDGIWDVMSSQQVPPPPRLLAPPLLVLPCRFDAAAAAVAGC